MRVVFASGNKGKTREVAELVRELGLVVVAQGELGIDSIEETGSTFAENALLKARHAAAVSGLPAIADDSGLSVAALGGRPGVFSARYAGEEASDEQNISKLLEELAALPMPERNAAFHCAAVYVADADADALISEGIWAGEILEERQGSGGFGYDPVFFDPDAGKSAANMTPAEKNARSHRGRAFHELVRMLREQAARV